MSMISNHHYTCTSYHRDGKVLTRDLVMSGEELYQQARAHSPNPAGRLAFLELLNRWNARGVNDSGWLHVYAAKQ